MASNIDWSKVPSGIKWDDVPEVNNNANTISQEAPKSSNLVATRIRRAPLYRFGTGVINSILAPAQLAAEGISAISKPGALAENWGQDLKSAIEKENVLDNAAIGDTKSLRLYDLVGSLLSPVSKFGIDKVDKLAESLALPGYLNSAVRGAGTGLISALTTPTTGDQSKIDQLDAGFNSGVLANAMLHTLGKGGDLLGELASRYLGGGLGIKEAYQAAKEGGAAAQAFMDAKNGITHPATVVEELKAAKDLMDFIRSKNYEDNVQQITSNPKGLKLKDFTQIQDAIARANSVATEFGESISPAVSNIKAQVADILSEASTKRALNILPSTLGGLNYTRRRLNDLEDSITSGGSLAAQKAIPAIISNEINDVMKKQLPGWATLQTQNAIKEKTLKDIDKSLALNDKAGTEAAINKMLKGLRNEFKGELLAGLEQYGPKNIIPTIAGLKTRDWAPTGLGQATQIGALSIALSQLDPKWAAVAAAQSPKLVGSAAYGLGSLTRGKESLIRALLGSPHMLDQVIAREYIEAGAQ